MAVSVDIRDSFVNIGSLGLKKKLEEVKRLEVPAFDGYKPDFIEIEKLAAKYKDRRNVIVIGNGGSVNSSVAIYESLKDRTSKQAWFVNTMEPDYLREVRKHAPRDISVAVVVSKSGTTLSPLEAMLFFSDYDKVAVTSETGTLREIASREGMDFLEHPEIGGRFAGITECALVPAALLGFPVREIYKGAGSMYAKCRPRRSIKTNPALQVATVLYVLENKGLTEIFCPIYSVFLSGFSMIIKQLMHETVCKQGLGQTVFCDTGPEVQHHSTQRFFGGRRNMAGLFIDVRKHKHDEKMSVPKNLRDVNLKGDTLGLLEGLRLSDALGYEMQGVVKHAKHEGIPHIRVSLSEISPYTVGEFLAFWQYVAVYSAVLRGVNPYDQPEVEYSKKATFDMIRKR